jgi:hypothetical protein
MTNEICPVNLRFACVCICTCNFVRFLEEVQKYTNRDRGRIAYTGEKGTESHDLCAEQGSRNKRFIPPTEKLHRTQMHAFQGPLATQQGWTVSAAAHRFPQCALLLSSLAHSPLSLVGLALGISSSSDSLLGGALHTPLPVRLRGQPGRMRALTPGNRQRPGWLEAAGEGRAACC